MAKPLLFLFSTPPPLGFLNQVHEQLLACPCACGVAPYRVEPLKRPLDHHLQLYIQPGRFYKELNSLYDSLREHAECAM